MCSSVRNSSAVRERQSSSTTADGLRCLDNFFYVVGTCFGDVRCADQVALVDTMLTL